MIVILLFTYRSPILWILPIFSVVVAYSVSGGVVYLLAKYADLTVNGQSQAILGILVIGAGTDYALLLVADMEKSSVATRTGTRRWASRFTGRHLCPWVRRGACQRVGPCGMLLPVLPPRLATRPAGLGPVNAVGHRRVTCLGS